MTFSEQEMEESKRLIREEIGSSSGDSDAEEEEDGDKLAGQNGEADPSEEAKAGNDERNDNNVTSGADSDESDDDDGELDLDALEAEKQAKKAKKLLPKKEKPVPQKKTKLDEAGELVINMDYVQKKARRQFKNKQTAQRAKCNKNKDKG